MNSVKMQDDTAPMILSFVAFDDYISSALSATPSLLTPRTPIPDPVTPTVPPSSVDPYYIPPELAIIFRDILDRIHDTQSP